MEERKGQEGGENGENRKREKERRKEIVERREIHLEEKPHALMGPWAELYS